MDIEDPSLRPLSKDEEGLLVKLFSREFPGRDALLAQVEGMKVRQIDPEGSLRLVPPQGVLRAEVEDRVPVEAELPDDRGLATRMLLHVVDGCLHELEVYRDDLGPIRQPVATEGLRLVLFGERAVQSQAEESSLPEGKLLRLNKWSEGGAWSLAAVTALIGILIAIPGEDSDLEKSLIGVGWIGIGLLLAGVARSGLVVHQEGIEVRGMVRTRRWSWPEVDHFEVKLPLLRGSLRIYLANGEAVSAVGLDGTSKQERQLAREWLAELNRRAGHIDE